MNKFFPVFLFIFGSFGITAQPGMYNEDDIALQTLFIDAQTAKYLEKPEEQVDLLKQLLEKDRTCTPCHYELSLAYLKIEDLLKAENSISKALKSEPNNIGYNQAAIQIFEASNNYAETTKVLTTLSNLNPNDASLQEDLVQNLIMDGKDDQALSILDKLDLAFGPYERTTMWKLEIYKKKKSKDDQLKAVEKLVKHYPENTRYLNNLASMYSEFGKDKAAKEAWTKVLELDPQDPSANFALMSETIDKESDLKFLRAILPLIENKSIELDEKIKELIPYVEKMSQDETDPKNVEILQLAERLITMYPNKAKAYALRGDVFYQLNDFDSAKVDYQKTTELNKGILAVWERRMRNEIQRNDIKALLKISTEAVDFFPLKFDPYFYNTLALMKSGNPSSAKDQMMEAKFMAGKSDLNKAKMDYLTALQFFSDKEYDKAIALLKAFQSSKLDEFLIPELLGDLYANKDNLKQAIDYWNISQKMGNKSSLLLKKISEGKYIN